MHDNFVIAVTPQGEWETIQTEDGVTSEMIAKSIASATSLLTYVPLNENLIMWMAPRDPNHFEFNSAATAIRCAYLSVRAGIPINLDSVAGTRGKVLFTGGHDLKHGTAALPVTSEDAVKVFIFCNLVRSELKKVKLH